MHKHRRHREKEKERYYLLPGQGGRASRRKQMMMLKAALGVGTVIALIVALFLYFLYSRSLR
jgi:hypothetical protein